MWIHGLGWQLPCKAAPAWFTVYRNNNLLYGSWLERTDKAPNGLQPCTSFMHQLLCGPWPMGPASAPCHIVHRHQPPTGLQLCPGQHLLLCLRLPWPHAERALLNQWPAAEWPLYLRRWRMEACPRNHARWAPEPFWVPAAPSLYKPLAATYHPHSEQAEWTFRLSEP